MAHRSTCDDLGYPASCVGVAAVPKALLGDWPCRLGQLHVPFSDGAGEPMTWAGAHRFLVRTLTKSTFLETR